MDITKVIAIAGTIGISIATFWSMFTEEKDIQDRRVNLFLSAIGSIVVAFALKYLM